MQTTSVASPRNQPFRTTRIAKASGAFFVWVIFFGKAEQGREVADEFDLEFAIDRVQTDFIDKGAEYFCSFVARCILI